MRLYLTANTNIPDVLIDFIEVRLKTEEEVSLNWDESDISRSDTGFEARYKGVYFGEEYANGRIADLEGLEILDLGLYFEADGAFEFKIEEMEFEDDEKSLTITDPVIPQDCSGLQVLKPKSLSKRIQSASTRAATASTNLKDVEKENAGKDSIHVTLSKSELALIKESLDVMGDRSADREGYSAGEVYWDLKEKLESFEQKEFTHMPPEPAR